MASSLSLLLLCFAALGIGLIALQIGWAIIHLRRRTIPPRSSPGISILKPLCGVDDGLLRNLESFATLDYPCYEVLLGVRDRSDPAYPVACAAAARWPMSMRVVLQRGTPGLNPKVNQLITLAQRARHDLFVISDSNVRVQPRYLDEIATHLGDPEVGIVTHPIAGIGEQSWGARFDNLHLCSSVGPGVIAANRIGQVLVIGKSMAFRRAELAAIGGFEALKDVLAEDFVMGRRLSLICQKRVVVARHPIMNVSHRRSARDFVERYTRWSIMQRKIVGTGWYTAQLVLNPVPFALAAVLIEPERHALAGLLMCGASKVALECLAIRAFRGRAIATRCLIALPLKDMLLLYAWLAGLMRSEIRWRGNRMLVLDGTRLAPVTPQPSWQEQTQTF
jgi:ceramide glucosyltransferase